MVSKEIYDNTLNGIKNEHAKAEIPTFRHIKVVIHNFFLFLY